jgi:DNA polymerase III delta subunit
MIISESNIDDMKYEVEQSIEEFGLIKTLKRYRFPFKLANIMFQLTRPFTNEECNQILYYYLFEKKVLSKTYEDKDVDVEISIDSMDWGVAFYHRV